jgi:hypothetical protein
MLSGSPLRLDTATFVEDDLSSAAILAEPGNDEG